MRVVPLLSVLGLALVAGLPTPAPAQSPDGVAWRVTTPTGGGPRASAPEICHVLYGGQCTIDLEGVRGPPSPDIPFPKVIPPEDLSFRPAGGLDPATDLSMRGPGVGAPDVRSDPSQQVLAPRSRPGAATSDVPMPADAPRNVLNPSPNGPPMTERTAVTGRTGVPEIDTLVDALKAAGLGDQLRPNIDPNIPGIVLVAPGNALAPPPAAPARPAAAQRAPAPANAPSSAPANAPSSAPAPAPGAAPSR